MSKSLHYTECLNHYRKTCVLMFVPPQGLRCQGRSFHHHTDGGRCKGRWGHCRRPAGYRCHGECPAMTGHSGNRDNVSEML